MMERHYTVKQLAKMWSVAEGTVNRMFANRPDVPDFGSGKYASLRIPESVATAAYQERLGGGSRRKLQRRRRGV